MNPVIENYEFLSSITEQMCAAISQGQWNHLVELEGQCCQRVASMKAQDAAIPIDESTRLRKVALIRKILADDKEIRNRIEPQLARLQHFIQGARQQHRLLETYFKH
jgi:flagellar protein FliT